MDDSERLRPLPPLEKFVDTIKERGLPIDEQDAKLFGEYVLEHNPPTGLLERLLAAFQYVDKEQFDKDFQIYSEMVKTQLVGKPYSCAIYEPRGSNFWIYKKLLEGGLHPAEKIFASASETDLRKFSMLDQEKINTLAPKDGVILIPDDLIITGVQITETLSECAKTQKPVVAVLYTTPRPKITIQNMDATLLSVKELVPAKQWLTDPDLEFLQDLSLKAFHQDHLATDLTLGNTALFWTWYKVPDNMFPIVVDEHGGLPHPSSPPLIRMDKFKQPYKEYVQEIPE